MTSDRRRPAALIALAALALAGLTPAGPAVAVAAEAGAGVPAPSLLDVLPEAVVDELAPEAQVLVEDALVAGDEGTTVSVAVDDGRGGLVVEAVPVTASAAEDVVAALDGLPSVEAADVASPVRALGRVSPAPGVATAASTTGAAADPFRTRQWALDALRADRLRPALTGTPVVAVVDTGVDATHPDLAGVVLPGLDLVRRGGDGRTDENGHGTHVAGTVGAVVGNGQGVAGVLSSVRVLPVRVLDRHGAGTTTDIARGVVWAADNGADVINLSLGGPQRDATLERAVAHATGKGVVVVAAMGNDGERRSPTLYPAASPGVIAVTALTRSPLARAPWSSQGAHADLAAPGASIISTVPRGGYGFQDGTSMAAPHVAAAAAGLLAAVPSATAADVAAALATTADDLGAPGRDAATGEGLVDPLEALGLLRAGSTKVPAAPQAVRTVGGDRRATVTWRAPVASGGRPTGYAVEVRGKGQPVQQVRLGAGVTTWTATGLVNGLGYEVRVRALGAAGEGPAAAVVVARPLTTPSAPRSVSAASGSTSDRERSIVVRWAAPSSNGGAVIARYEVLVRESGTTRDVVLRAPATATSFSATGLRSGASYTAVVRAVTSAGTGPASARTAAVAAR